MGISKTVNPKKLDNEPKNEESFVMFCCGWFESSRGDDASQNSYKVGYLEQKSGRKEDVFYNLRASMHSGKDCGRDSQDVTGQPYGPKSRLTKSTPAKTQNMRAMQRSIECHGETLHKVKIALKQLGSNHDRPVHCVATWVPNSTTDGAPAQGLLGMQRCCRNKPLRGHPCQSPDS